MSPEVGTSTSKKALAEELGVSRSSLYYKPKLPEKDELLRVEIESIIENNHGYGHRRVADALGINKKRARRVMKKYNLKPLRRSRAPSKPEDIDKEESAHPDITQTLSAVAPDVIWTGDFTYIPFKGKFIYLAVVQDRWSAEILGSRIMKTHHAELVVDTLLDALRKYKTLPEYFHSDQGSEYTCKEFESLLNSNNIIISNSPKSSPWRNGSQESFFGRFKVEFGDFDRFDTLEKLMSEIYQYIFYYNQHRIHTRLRTSPRAFRLKYFQSSLDYTKPLENLDHPYRSYQQN